MRIQVFHDGLDPRHGRRRIHTLHSTGSPVQVGQLLVEIRLHVGQLRSNLGLEVLEASRNFLKDLCVSLRAGLPKLTHVAAVSIAQLALASPVESGVRWLDRSENVLLVGMCLGNTGQLIQQKTVHGEKVLHRAWSLKLRFDRSLSQLE